MRSKHFTMTSRGVVAGLRSRTFEVVHQASFSGQLSMFTRRNQSTSVSTSRAFLADKRDDLNDPRAAFLLMIVGWHWSQRLTHVLLVDAPNK